MISPKSAEKSSKEDSAESGEVPSRVNPSEDSHEGDTRDAGSPDNDKTAEHRKGIAVWNFLFLPYGAGGPKDRLPCTLHSAA